jgi:hypothetical protein
MTYYDPDKPYSIENWNTLIQAVNVILAGPPEDSSNCQPIDAIDEVEDPHLWSVEDVTEVRTKLKGTCPDIDFSEELVLWKQAIIDEIVDQMDDAWCDCEPETEPIDETLTLCSHVQEAMNAGWSTNSCCGAVVEDSPCVICIGSHCRETEYQGGWYESPSINNIPKYNTICDTDGEAYSAGYNFITYLNQTRRSGLRIENFQDWLDEATENMDALIEQYEEDCQGPSIPGECYAIKANICAYGESARSYQDLVDEEVIAYRDWHDRAMEKLGIANSAAQQNSVAALGLQGRFPTDHNITAECIADAIPVWPWYDYWDPTKGNIGDLHDYIVNDPSVGGGVFVSVKMYRINSNNPEAILDHRNVRLSPDGTWYISGYASELYNRSYSHTYLERRSRWRCEPAISCNPDPGTCTFPDWPDFEKVWWDQGWPSTGSCVGSCTGFNCRIWQPLPEPDLESFGEDTFYLHIRKPGGVTDVSGQRDAWLAERYNWYDTHEQYDDRHQPYC